MVTPGGGDEAQGLIRFDVQHKDGRGEALEAACHNQEELPIHGSDHRLHVLSGRGVGFVCGCQGEKQGVTKHQLVMCLVQGFEGEALEAACQNQKLLAIHGGGHGLHVLSGDVGGLKVHIELRVESELLDVVDGRESETEMGLRV